MRLNTYTIFDTAAGAYMRPFFLQADSQAIRSFKDIALDKDHAVGQHPEDYSLVRVGTFDDQTGLIHPETVEVLINGLRVIADSQNVNQDKLEAFQAQIAKGDGADDTANGEQQHSLDLDKRGLQP